jgi:hypothetical protein
MDYKYLQLIGGSKSLIINKQKTYKNGDIYNGQTLNDKKHGQGIMNYKNGDIYDGNWNNNKRHDQGIMNYVNNDTYSGNWVDDLKSGQGIMQYANGSEFNGTWDNDMPNTGLLTFVDNTIIEYHDGKQINNKPEDLKSIPIIDQQENDCWAHAISRNFVRTFQILSIIKFEFIQKFYDLFYTILTEYKTCKDGYYQSEGMFYLFVFHHDIL